MIEAICNTALCQENIFDTQSYKIVEAIYAYVVAIKMVSSFVNDGNDSAFDLENTCESLETLEKMLDGSLEEGGNDPKVLKNILTWCAAPEEPVFG